MSPRRLLTGALLVFVGLAGALVITGGKQPYSLKLHLANAYGLSSGSAVVIGGVPAGKVSSIKLAGRDGVVAVLALDSNKAPVGRDVSVAIKAANLLGQKQVEVLKGNTQAPLPSGSSVGGDRVTTATDLDQVLNVLDVDTRARLTLLLDEAGTAVTGRKVDLNQLLRELPTSVVDARQLLERLVSDNHSLGGVLDHSNRFVAEVAAQRRSLSGMTATIAHAASTGASRHAELRATLARAPGTLRTLRAFLSDLTKTTVPLGPAAREISLAAPPIAETLAQVEPFRIAAAPTLSQATKVAPQLTELANGATPVLARAVPTTAALADFSRRLSPVSTTLSASADNAIATVENWTRAIQFRDGLSHIFRGEASVSPDTLRSLIGADSLPLPSAVSPASAKPAQPPALPHSPRSAAPGNRATGARPAQPSQPTAPGFNERLQQILQSASAALPGVAGPTSPPPAPAQPAQAVKPLLDYLMGK